MEPQPYNGKITIEHRITKLEESLNNVKESMKQIRTNELPHLKRRMDQLILLVVSALIALVGNLALNIL